MSRQPLLLHLTLLALVGAASSACMPMPPAERAVPANARSFAVTHHSELERELRGGGGPHVRTLATLARCPNINDAARALTEQRDRVYPAPNAAVAADRLVDLLAANTQLGCNPATTKTDGVGRALLQQPGQAPAEKAADRANMKERYGE